MKPYPRYKDSGVGWLGEIPEHWKLAKLKRITQFMYGQSLPAEKRIPGEVPVYGSNGTSDFHNASITKKPCIIVGRKGAFGKVNYSETECFPINTTYYIDKNATSNNLRWLYYLLKIMNLDSFSKDFIIPGLSRDDVYEKKIFQTPISEQHQIANYLDHKTHQIDTLIAKKQRLIKLLKEERTAVINEAVTKGIDPDAPMKDSGIEWMGEIPGHWETKRFKHIVKKIGSGVTPRGGADVYQESGIPLLRSQNIHFDGLRLDDVAYISEDIFINMLNSEVFEGDVLLNITGASIGRCYYVDGALGKANVNQHVCILRPNNQIETKYLYLILSSHIGQLQVFNKQVGANREGLNFEQLKNFIFPNPPKNERYLIIEYVEKETNRIDTLITKTNKEIELLQEFRTALISEAVTGKIDVRDWEQPQNDRQTH